MTDKLTPTRHTEASNVYITRAASGLWRHVDMNEKRAAHVGPQYRTQAELMADHEAYMVRAGWIKE